MPRCMGRTPEAYGSRRHHVYVCVCVFDEIISAISNGLHTFGRDQDVTSRAICIKIFYVT